MRNLWWFGLILLLAGPALAQEPVALSSWQVVLAGKFSLRVASEGKEFRRIAKPRVLTADGIQAEIRMSGLKRREEADDKDKFDFALSALPKVLGEGASQRIRLQLKLEVEVPGQGPLRQSCTVTATPGEPVEFGLEMPGGKEEFQVEVTAWAMDRHTTIKSWDAEGKPIFIRSN